MQFLKSGEASLQNVILSLKTCLSRYVTMVNYGKRKTNKHQRVTTNATYSLVIVLRRKKGRRNAYKGDKQVKKGEMKNNKENMDQRAFQ